MLFLRECFLLVFLKGFFFLGGGRNLLTEWFISLSERKIT